MLSLKKLPGVLVLQDGKHVYVQQKHKSIDFERYFVMPAHEGNFKDLLRYLPPADLRVLLALARRVVMTTAGAYARKFDYKTIAADLEITPSVAHRAIARLAAPMEPRKGKKVDIPELTRHLIVTSVDDFEDTVLVLNPDYVAVGEHKKQKALWKLAEEQRAWRVFWSRIEDMAAEARSQIAGGARVHDVVDLLARSDEERDALLESLDQM